MSGSWYFPLFDHNGNATHYVSEQGSIAAQYTYDAFGRTLTATGPLADAFRHRFSTKYFDVESGLYYYGYRFYAPELMRWLSRDPLKERSSPNLYILVGNTPVVFWDYLGLDWMDNASNFSAGVGDSLTFGLTRQIRHGINWLIWGFTDDVGVEPDSAFYVAGEVTEVVVEIAITAGGATLRHVAKRTAREALEGGARQAFRRTHKLQGGFVHHVNPIKGHPGGSVARYPLPFEWSAKGYWNMQWVPNRATHNALHTRMMAFESLNRYRESTLLLRQAANRLAIYAENESGGCLDSIEVSAKVYGEAPSDSSGTSGQNAVPDSVTVEGFEFGTGIIGEQ
jgi:RHS repeat-associated protein